jgi:hypothetical protein
MERCPKARAERRIWTIYSDLWRGKSMDKKSKKEEALEQEGWKKMTTTSEPRLTEMVELYESLGFEVRIEEVDLEFEECTECIQLEPENTKTIYVRKKESQKD